MIAMKKRESDGSDKEVGSDDRGHEEAESDGSDTLGVDREVVLVTGFLHLSNYRAEGAKLELRSVSRMLLSRRRERRCSSDQRNQTEALRLSKHL